MNTVRTRTYGLVLLAGVVFLIGLYVWQKNDTEQPVFIPIDEVVEAEEQPAIVLAPKEISFADGTEAVFLLDENFNVAVVAENLGKARFMTKSPDGRFFVPDMVDYALSQEGKVWILDDFNEETKQFETKATYLSDLRGPNNIAFYTDENGVSWLYMALTEHLIRYPYQAGDMTPSGPAEILYTFPNEQSEDAVGTVWHITRTIHFSGDTLFVSIGSGCNSCEESPDEFRAGILAMNPDGTAVRTYADGLRNAVGLGVVDGVLYATENGVDHLGDDAPDDVLYAIREGMFYGWPYCYEVDGEKVEDTSRAWNLSNFDCSTVPTSFVSFDPHSAPLGFAYFSDENTHPKLRNSFLVALQGSWNQGIGTGYQVMRVSLAGDKEVFMDGFIEEEGERVGRPVDVFQYNEDSFFVTDDFNGRMYYVHAERS
jgi:glucose/arabinose dehydrogenase